MLKIKFRKTAGEKALGLNIAQDGLYIFLVWWEGALLWVSRPTPRAADLAYCVCKQPTYKHVIVACDDCGLPIRQTANA